MAEVAEAREAHAAVREDLRGLRRGRSARAAARTAPPARRGRRGSRRATASAGRREERRPPRGAEDGVHEIRDALAERQRADEDAEREAAPRLEPRREDLHPRRVDAREPEARQEAQDERRGGTVREEREAARSSPAPRRLAPTTSCRGAQTSGRFRTALASVPATKPSWTESVSHVAADVRKPPLGLQERRDRRRREPERHPEELRRPRGGRGRASGPAGRRRVAARRRARGRRAHAASGTSLPGFRIPFGSSAAFTARMAARYAGGRRSGRKFAERQADAVLARDRPAEAHGLLEDAGHRRLDGGLVERGAPLPEEAHVEVPVGRVPVRERPEVRLGGAPPHARHERDELRARHREVQLEGHPSSWIASAMPRRTSQSARRRGSSAASATSSAPHSRRTSPAAVTSRSTSSSVAASKSRRRRASASGNGTGTPFFRDTTSTVGRSTTSQADGTRPRRWISKTAFAADSSDGNGARTVAHAAGFAMRRSHAFVTTASVPSLPTRSAVRS